MRPTHKDYEPVKIIKKNEIFYGVLKKRENLLDENMSKTIKTVTIRISFRIFFDLRFHRKLHSESLLFPQPPPGSELTGAPA